MTQTPTTAQAWQQIARTISTGSSRKIACCSADRSASVSNLPRGIALHCFRCGRKEFEPHGIRSIAEVMQARRALDNLAAQKAHKMPQNAVPLAQGPAESWLWVLQGGLTPEIASDTYGMRWHEGTRRVLIPIPGGLLGRAVFGERPKYRMLTAKPGALYWPSRRDGDTLIVAEDILSAIAIDRVGWPAVAVLGTAINPMQAARIADGRTDVIGWFDGDKAGDKAHKTLRHRLRLFDLNISRIRTSQDPKRLRRAVLRDIITQHIGELACSRHSAFLPSPSRGSG